jgi:NADH-ubiquinone oxidoreductase chain 5
LGSIFTGYLLKDNFLGLGSTFWNNSIFFLPVYYSNLDFEFIPLFIKNLPLLGSLSGIILAIFFNKAFYHKFLIPSLHKYLVINNKDGTYITILFNFILNSIFFLHYKWYFDYIFNNFFGFFLLKHSYSTFYKVVDKGVIEVITIDLLSSFIKKISMRFSLQNVGYVYNLLCLLFLGFIIFYTLCLIII